MQLPDMYMYISLEGVPINAMDRVCLLQVHVGSVMAAHTIVA